jgi:flagellar biosynthesis chaperone FliJ
MTITNKSQLENTRQKLKSLEEEYASLKSQPRENVYTRELTLQSLQRWIKKLKEEIARYECTTTSGRS